MDTDDFNNQDADNGTTDWFGSANDRHSMDWSDNQYYANPANTPPWKNWVWLLIGVIWLLVQCAT